MTMNKDAEKYVGIFVGVVLFCAAFALLLAFRAGDSVYNLTQDIAPVKKLISFGLGDFLRLFYYLGLAYVALVFCKSLGIVANVAKPIVEGVGGLVSWLVASISSAIGSAKAPSDIEARLKEIEDRLGIVRELPLSKDEEIARLKKLLEASNGKQA